MHQTRVLIVDDSALVRQTLSKILGGDPGIEVVGTANDPYEAREKIKRLNPDVLTLDVEMPRMDGIQFLRNLMRLRPMPVLMVSSLTEKGAQVTLEALDLGAVDFVSKPKFDLAHSLEDYAEQITAKVKLAARARIRIRDGGPAQRMASPPVRLGPVGTSTAQTPLRTTERIVAVGSSTGGTEAIREILERLPADTAAIVIAQHIPPLFSRSFSERMNQVSAMTVCEATQGQQILPGHVYIAPGDSHLRVVRDGARYVCALGDDEPVNLHRPSVDVLFESVARQVGANAVGVILTGMGSDGARGLKLMREAGAPTFAQDERTSVVWGMPGQAVQLGAADEVIPLGEFPERISNITHR